MKLHGHISTSRRGAPLIVRLTRDAQPTADPNRQAYLFSSADTPAEVMEGRSVIVGPMAVMRDLIACDRTASRLIVGLPESLNYLSPGDVVRINPEAAELRVIYRAGSTHNALLMTERCNSNCIMCSQPPKDVDDSHLVDDILEAIPLMSPETIEVCLTGGEPLLLHDRLLQVMAACRHHLPTTALHVLTNGRLFAYLEYARRVAAINHPDLMFGIPLYSDLPVHHDFVVQAKGAFDQTIRGVLNLARFHVGTELRVVIHRQTYARLPELARFIARNLPFVNHVALMGLEMMGYVRMNLEALWIDPVDYQPELRAAVMTLHGAGLRVSIYNHQLCILDRDLWPFARKSISDWKNMYIDLCDECAVKANCGGFFASAQLRYSDHIAPVLASPDVPMS